MEIDERKNVPQVLYETRHHASRPFSSNYPPIHHQQVNESSKRGFFRLLSAQGLSNFRDKWTSNKHQQKLSKWISMFISPSGEHVAIAVGNEITILRRDDNYQQPCAIFTSSFPVTFTFGAWSEDHGVLGVFDNADTLYFIRANGEEITRITKQHLKVPLPVVSIFIYNDKDTRKSCLCTFSILAADGSVYDIEISQDPSASIFTMSSLSGGSLLQKQFPQNVCCCGYHPDNSLFAVVSSTVSITSTSSDIIGPYSISIWQWCRQSGLQQVASAEFEGLYTKTKGYSDQISLPKVLFSPQGEFVAMLDLRGRLAIYKLKEHLLSEVHFKENNDSSNIIDFTWWTDCIVVIANRSGNITMIDIDRGVKVLENDCKYSLPILERVQWLAGCIFILESRSSEKNFELSDLLLFEPVTAEKYKQFDNAKLQWSLVSFSKRSAQELYDILISSQQFQAALELADQYGLDKDEVLKGQWLHSAQGKGEISTLLSLVKDQDFVLSECLERVGPTEDSVRALLAYGLHLTNDYKFSEVDHEERSQIWDFRLARLKMLQFRDRLETFIGINMGRFSAQDYSKFRSLPINEAATALAESGKIGALNLLFKRHPYSVTPCMLEVLAAIPETVPVQTYGQLLPGSSPPQVTTLREEDWVEREKMVNYIKTLPENHESTILIRTEPIVKQLMGYKWPSADELSFWYKQRARDMDSLSGQLDNCIALVDFACRKGVKELQEFHELISYLHQLIYSDDDDHDLSFSMSLITWEQLSDYEKFKLMLKGFNEENVIKRLRDRAVPFMKKRTGAEVVNDPIDSFFVRWMKEVAMENKIEVCLIVVEEGCQEFGRSNFFRNECEAVECVLQCLYMFTVTDKWNTMASILSKLPHLQGSEVESPKKKLRLAEDHVKAGRLLALYQVPKPIAFFLEAQTDSKSVKQILRLILSKFIRRQPGRTDNDWANMWRDFQSLQEKAFPFIDLEYMLMEFCRGLLKAGKFLLARNYLKGSGSLVLPTEKAESIIILAARESFFSASSLSCSEIWKAKECLNILPSSRNVMVELDIIDALTVKLPRLGVHILPMQFRQIKDPMEIIKLAITSQNGAYLNVDELIEIAKLLGLNSHDEISSVQEAIAREAAVAGDLQLAFDLCLTLAKKGHGPVWDLCTALARGPALENMDISSRKQLLGFALSHCDKDSIGELLHAWKDLDMLSQCEKLSMFTGKDVPELSGHDIDLIDSSGQVNADICDEQNSYFTSIKTRLFDVADLLSAEKPYDFDSLLKENGKMLTFVALRLPWLLDLSQEAENGKKFLGTQAMTTVFSWLARNDLSPKDNLVASLAKLIMKPPVTEEEDILGCSFLLNLNDAFYGVQIIEEQVKSREDYDEICSMMNLGMIYSLLHNSSGECEDPVQRRELLLRKFQEKYTSLSSDERNKIDQAQSSFWREWKLKLEEQKRVAERTRAIEQIIPGIESARFLSGDINYKESVILSFVESVKTEKKRILKDVLKLASDYGLDQIKVLLKFLSSTLLSNIWTVDDIKSEVSQFESEILDSAEVVFKTISFSVYPEIDGRNKECLAYIYNLLSICFSRVEEKNELLSSIGPDPPLLTIEELNSFYKNMEQDCNNLSFIKDLNFKNIAGIFGPNRAGITTEVYAHVNERSVEALAEMVKTLTGIFKDQVPEGLVPWQYVYGYYVSSSLTALENKAKSEVHFQNPETLALFINELESTYDRCKKYIGLIAYPGASVTGIMKKFFKITPSLNGNFDDLADPKWKDDLVVLLNFWLRLIDDLQKFVSSNDMEGKFSPTCVMICLEAFVELVKKGIISISEGWESLFAYINFGLTGDVYTEILNFCRSMIFSGCHFKAISYVYHAAISHFSPNTNLSGEIRRHYENIMDLPHLYIRILETILKDLARGSGEHQCLYRVLSSLSELDGDLEELKNVRSAVWDRLAQFSDNMEIPSHVRVHMLELMQYITALTANLTSFSTELRVNVAPWDGCDNTGIASSNNETAADNDDVPNRFTHTLVALKSSQLLSTISPTLEITPNDLSTLDSAVSCFLNLSENAVSQSDINVLISILGEWERLFGTKSAIGEVKNSEQTSNSAEAETDWGNDDWDEGWEDFQEEESSKIETTNNETTPLVHALHECWAEVFKKLASLSQFNDIMKIIDQSKTKGYGVLLNEDAAHNLTQLLLEVDCFITLKIAVLFPYEKIQLECLGFVEEKLKLGNIPGPVLTDHELFISLLSSGLVSTIITKPSYGNTFSYLNYMVGNFCRNCQEAHISGLHYGRGTPENDIWFVFKTVLLPCYLSELVKANQVMLAGLVVTKIMHTSVSLGLINLAEASLRKYLETQLEVLQGNSFKFEEMNFCESLVNTVGDLSGRLENLIKSALGVLSPSVVKR